MASQCFQITRSRELLQGATARAGIPPVGDVEFQLREGARLESARTAFEGLGSTLLDEQAEQVVESWVVADEQHRLVLFLGPRDSLQEFEVGRQVQPALEAQGGLGIQMRLEMSPGLSGADGRGAQDELRSGEGLGAIRRDGLGGQVTALGEFAIRVIAAGITRRGFCMPPQEETLHAGSFRCKSWLRVARSAAAPCQRVRERLRNGPFELTDLPCGRSPARVFGLGSAADLSQVCHERVAGRAISPPRVGSPLDQENAMNEPEATTQQIEPDPLYELPGESCPLSQYGLGAVVDGLLKAPAQVLHEIRAHGPVAAPLLAIAALSLAMTGLVMASHAGGMQLAIVPLRVTLGLFFGAAICLPSLHILSSLGGGTQTLRETVGILIMVVAILALLLVGFAPVGFVFSQATESNAFLGGMYLLFLGVSAAFAGRLLRGAFEQVSGRALPVLRLWLLVFVLVLVQLSVTLRPLIGTFEGYRLQDRRFFLEHWSQELD